MALPPALTAVEPVAVRGFGGGRQGDLRVDGVQGRFERSAQRVTWFERVESDRVSASLSLQRADGSVATVRCRARQVSVGAGVVDVPVRPYGVACQWSDGAELTLAATLHPTRDERVGQYRADGVVLALRSVHEVQGSPLALAAPIGYWMLDGGSAVGAVELNGTTPRLWRPAEARRQRAVTEAALVLALLWDPASR